MKSSTQALAYRLPTGEMILPAENKGEGWMSLVVSLLNDESVAFTLSFVMLLSALWVWGG